MESRYDKHTDTLVLQLKSSPVKESDERNEGIILDFDDSGHLVSIEILDASRRVNDVQHMNFEVAE